MGLPPPIPRSLDQIYQPINAELEEAKARFDAELASDRPFVNALCERVRHYRGKMLRPALLLLTGKAVGELTDDHPTLAAVVELVHIATLVHDDVLDQADLRRRQATVNHMTGNEAAVLLGDYLISHAFHLCCTLGNTAAAREIGATTNRVCEGELTQIHHRGNPRLTEAEYLEIIAAKTGALTGTCCALGARFAEAPEAWVEAARRFGTDAGMAFQIIDDLLDLTGSPDRAGKSLGRDLDLGKPTLPMIHALRTGPPESRTRLEAMIAGRPAPDPGAVRQVLQSSESLAYAAEVASRFVRSASSQLERFPESAARESLAAMTEFILRRDH